MKNFNTNTDNEETWLTPRWIIEDLGDNFDLDPCTIEDRPWPTANHHLTIKDDGFATSWDNYGLVWCNPPYGRKTFDWLEKLSKHKAGGIALIFARTETKGFFKTVWEKASAVLFLEKRIKFCYADGTEAKGANAPSVLIAYGDAAVERLKLFNKNSKRGSKLITL